MHAAIPILRIFDQAKAYEFYRDFLGFEVVWEHRFADGLPLYAEVAFNGIRLHLSEHHGDASPGGAVIIEIDDARALQQRLVAADYGFARPGVSQEEWGLVVTVHDPFHNRLMFTQRTAPPREQRDAAAEPIVHTVTVPAAPDRAFEIFTGRTADWWDPELTADAATFRSVHLPPEPGGEVHFEHDDGSRYRVGTVTRWLPGERFAMSFCLSMDPRHPSRLTVDFAPSDAGTTVTLEHAGWTPANAGERDRFTQWPHLLERFAACVRSS